MNCFSAFNNMLRHLAPVLALMCVAACGVSDSESADRENELEYSIHYTLTPDPGSATVKVEIRLRQPRGLLRELSFPESAAINELGGDGELQVFGERVHWQPPARGGSLKWRATVQSGRGDGTFDALLTPGWGVFRMEDIIPRARSRTIKGAHSRTTLSFDLPAGWSAMTEYRETDGKILVERPGRRFGEPAGWVAVGDLGIRRETIAGVRVAVAAPKDHGVRRMDMLALLNWTLPELVSVLPDALPRLTVIGAGEPMWRGGLSGPASFFIHAERPLISENATSALLHEVMHTALSLRPEQGHDWIAEGLAEYYSVELLRRGKAISRGRHEKAIADQLEWAQQATRLCGRTSTGPTTALAVTIFRRLNAELVERTSGQADLDELVRRLVAAGSEVSLQQLSSLAASLGGEASDVRRRRHDARRGRLHYRRARADYAA